MRKQQTDVDALKARAMATVLENAKRICIETEGIMFGLDPAADAILVNAERLLADAAILAQQGSHRSALALAALSFEESGKSCIVRWRHAGLLTRNIQEEIRALHKAKQRVYLAYINAKALYDFTNNENEPLTRFRELGDSALLLIHNGVLKNELFVEIIFIVGELDGILRLSGFYQDLNEDYRGVDFKVCYNQMSERASKSLVMGRADPATLAMTAYFYEWWRMQPQSLEGNDRVKRLEMLFETLERSRQTGDEIAYGAKG